MPEALASLGPISGARIGLNAKGKAGFTHFRFYAIFPVFGWHCCKQIADSVQHIAQKSSTKISTSLNCKNVSVQTKHPICCPLKVLLISYREVLSIIPKERDKYS